MVKRMKKENKKCPCGSGEPAEICCLPVILGETRARSPEQLMRSRYSAYAMGIVGYILSSWHSTTRPAEMTFEGSPSWSGLKIIDASGAKSVQAGEAYVEFIAGYLESGVPGVMRERSRFLMEEGQWRYVDGVQIDTGDQTLINKPGRNDPCICGSGRKFKKCCG